MVAKVSGGSWELLGWSLSGGSPPMMEGQRRFRKVTQAWMNGSWKTQRRGEQRNAGLGGDDRAGYVRRAPLSCQSAICQV